MTAPRGERRIFLARHGETDWNRVGRWQGATDIPLSDVGRAQARALADRLRGHDIAQVHASDLVRAHETAQLVAASLGIPSVAVDTRLRERGFGCFEGLTREECAVQHPEAWQRYLADRRSTPPGAEAQDQVVARVVAALTAIASSVDEDKVALVVSHGGAIRSFMAAINGQPPPPLANGALFVARFADDRFIAVDDLTQD
jgi:probable phosphoglycerate mutase